MKMFCRFWNLLNHYEDDYMFIERIYLGETHIDHGPARSRQDLPGASTTKVSRKQQPAVQSQR